LPERRAAVGMFEGLGIEAANAGGHADKGTRPSMDVELNARLDRIEGMLTTLVERPVE
jgi:hypothetical protein